MIKITIDDEPASEHISKLKQKMSDYMIRGKAHDDIGPFEEEGFNQGGVYSLTTATLTADKVLEGAIKIRTTCENRGDIETDSSVEEAMPIATEGQPRAYQYYSRAGPVASTHDNLRWNTACRLSDDAPAYKSDAWKAEASKLSIPEREELVPKLVGRFYAYLEEVRDRDDRPAHREELIGEAANAKAKDRTYDKALRYLEEFSGVEPPERDAPAWIYLGEEP